MSEPKHGEERNYRIEPGSMGGQGFHSESERYCANCNEWCSIIGAAGGLYWHMMHESKECIKPLGEEPFPKWVKRWVKDT